MGFIGYSLWPIGANLWMKIITSEAEGGLHFAPS